MGEEVFNLTKALLVFGSIVVLADIYAMYHLQRALLNKY